MLFLTGNVKTKKISEMSGIFIRDIPSEHHKNYFGIPHGIFQCWKSAGRGGIFFLQSTSQIQ